MKLSLIIDIILVTVIWITATVGYKKGLIKTLYGLAAFVFAAVFTAIFHEKVSQYFMSLEFVKNLVTKINEKLTDTIVSTTEFSSFMPNWMGETVESAIQSAGVTVASKIMEIIIIILTVLLTFFLAKLILGLIVGILDALMKLPILDTLNRTGGMLVGIVKGVLIILICFGIVSMFVTADKYHYIHNEINNTYIAKYFYNNNILMRLIIK